MCISSSKELCNYYYRKVSLIPKALDIFTSPQPGAWKEDIGSWEPVFVALPASLHLLFAKELGALQGKKEHREERLWPSKCLVGSEPICTVCTSLTKFCLILSLKIHLPVLFKW
jgi:hypothetical protein